VVFSLVQYLLAFLGGTIKAAEVLRHRKQQQHIGPPKCFLKPWKMGPEFLYLNVAGVLQYTIVMPVVTFVAVITWSFGVFGDGKFEPDVAYPWVVGFQAKPYIYL
jgi:hypothetical protein